VNDIVESIVAHIFENGYSTYVTPQGKRIKNHPVGSTIVIIHCFQ
jgi:hypothetical protein